MAPLQIKMQSMYLSGGGDHWMIVDIISLKWEFKREKMWLITKAREFYIVFLGKGDSIIVRL